MRLDKLLSHVGLGSRKDVREVLKKGRVTVDNKVIKDGSIHVEPMTQKVSVDNKYVDYEKYVYLMLHKPPGYISATYDKYEKTVIDIVPKEFKHFELFPVGRLDKDTEGLLLLTNDGETNHQLTSPKKEIYKKYFAKIDNVVSNSHIEEFKQGVVLEDGYKTKEAHLEILKSDTISHIHISIAEGKFHQVKRMFQAIGMNVIYLKRVSMGELYLDEKLPIGKIRRLNEEEMTYVLSLKK